MIMYVARVMDGLVLVETIDQPQQINSQMKMQGKQLMKKLHSMPPKCSVEAGNSVFHYICESGVCFMGLFDKNYPKNAAFGFLDDIMKLFQEELKREFGAG